MFNKFVYVFSVEDKEKLLNRGYTLLKDDSANNVYIFKSDESITFSALDGVEDYVTSDVLTF